MDTAFMRKTFALIAKGLIEKEQLLQAEPTRYPYSKAMQHGINMFLAASQWAGSQVAIKYPDEASFLAHFITRPIEEWRVAEGNRMGTGSCRATASSGRAFLCL